MFQSIKPSKHARSFPDLGLAYQGYCIKLIDQRFDFFVIALFYYASAFQPIQFLFCTELVSYFFPCNIHIHTKILLSIYLKYLKNSIKSSRAWHYSVTEITPRYILRHQKPHCHHGEKLSHLVIVFAHRSRYGVLNLSLC